MGVVVRANTTKLLVFVSLAINLLVCLIILVVRFRSNLEAGAFFPTNGAESLMAYSIWKVKNHFPLYELPYRSPYALTLYNYLFYFCYAWILQFVDSSGSNLLVYGRMITLGMANLGIVSTVRLITDGSPIQPPKRNFAFYVTIATLAWITSSFLGWYALTLRPDVIAVAFGCLGICVATRAVALNSILAAAVSAALFYVGWAFKQSAVSLFLGTCISLAIWRRWRLLGTVTLTFLFAVVVTLIAGGPEYRYNLLMAPGVVDSYSLKFVISEWAKAGLLNLYIWVGALSALLWTATEHLKQRPQFSDIAAITRTIVSCAFVVTLLTGSVLLSKVGAAKNHLLECFVMATILAAWQTVRAYELPLGSAMRVMTVCFCLLWGVYPLVQLAFATLGAREQGSGVATGDLGLRALAQLRYGKTPWHLQIAYPGELEQRKQLAAELNELPKPLYIRDEIFLLPWYAAANKYPAYDPDPIFEAAAVHRGIMQSSLNELVRSRHFATLVVDSQDGIAREAINSGYVQTSAIDIAPERFLVLSRVP